MHLGCMTTLAIGSNGSEGFADCASMRPETMSSRTTTNHTSLGIVFSSSRPELILHRQLPDSLSGRSEDRVGQRRCRDRRTWLADAPGLLTVPHQDHFDRRRLIDPKDANIMEVRLLHPAV